MERNKRIFGNSEDSKRNFEPKRIVIRNRFAKIYPKKEYVVISDDREIIIGYRYIKEFYITVHNSLPLKYLYALAKIKKVYLIDEKNFVVGEINV